LEQERLSIKDNAFIQSSLQHVQNIQYAHVISHR